MKNDFSYYLRKFLTEYLPREKGFNTNMIDSYRLTFILLLEYFKTQGLKAEKLKISDMSEVMFKTAMIKSFIDIYVSPPLIISNEQPN